MLTGKKLGRYEIREKIGAGGMGEVYLAHDEQLDRNVALKVLLPEFSKDAERVQRFKLEARAASALNHPNIITIHDVGEIDDRLYIATEFVNGETLREKISEGELTPAQAVKIAEQVADAIDAAHEQHIVHRDIKPENIMIRRDGYAKILDFGLAKPTVNHAPGAEEATLQMVQTQAGLVMGSVRYMSPEQARGKKTDERTDVWSLGVVLYEMITGQNPFDGETVSDSLAALIHVEPAPIENFVSGIPRELQAVITKALSKKAEDRYATAKDMASDLRHVHYQLEHSDISENRTMHVPISATDGVDRINTNENPTLIHQTLSAEVAAGRATGDVSLSGSAAKARRSNFIVPIVVIVLAVALGAGAWWLGPRLTGHVDPFLENVQVSRLTDQGKSFFPEISPDGKYVAFVNIETGMNSLLLRQVGTDSAVQIVSKTNNRIPQATFSHDGNYIYYTLVDNGVGTVYQIPTLGVSVSGSAKKIITDVDSKISFSPDSKQFAFTRHNPNSGGDKVLIAAADGSEQNVFLDSKELGYSAIKDVAWSPDGESLLIGAFKRSSDGQQRTKLILVSVKDKKQRPVSDHDWIGAGAFNWVKDGSGIIFVGKDEPENTSQIWYLPIAGGKHRQITNDLSDYVSLSLADDDKTMATSKVDTISSFWTFDPNTKETTQISSENRNNAGFGGIDAGSNGKIYYSKRAGKGTTIFEAAADGSAEKQIFSDGTFNFHPVLTRDGKYIVFSSNRSGNSRIWRVNADGSNPVKLSDDTDNEDFDPQITTDNKNVVFTRATKDGGKATMMSVSIDGGTAKPTLPENSPPQAFFRISPDGKKLAYCSMMFDEQRVTVESTLKVVGFDDSEVIGKQEKEVPMTWGDVFEWDADGKGMIYAGTDGNSNVWQMSFNGDKPKQWTQFNSGRIVAMAWAADFKKLYIVRGVVNSDLILIREAQK